MTGWSKTAWRWPPCRCCACGGLVALAARALIPGRRRATAGRRGDRAAGSWDGDQIANAVTIVRVGADLGVPRRGWVIAVATAIQESGLRNLGHLGAATTTTRSACSSSARARAGAPRPS